MVGSCVNIMLSSFFCVFEKQDLFKCEKPMGSEIGSRLAVIYSSSSCSMSVIMGLSPSSALPLRHVISIMKR